MNPQAKTRIGIAIKDKPALSSHSIMSFNLKNVKRQFVKRISII